MDVFQSGTPVDYFEYFSKQFPEVVLNMARLRDELALRQGAINAVQDTLKAREEAQFILANAKQEAANLLAQAKVNLDNAENKSAEANALLAQIKAQAADFAKNADAQMTQIQSREKLCADRAKELSEKESALAAKEQSLARMQSDLDAKVKEFQSRVANIAGLAG